MGNFDGRFVWYELATTDIEAAKACIEAIKQYVSYHEWFVASVEKAIAKADAGGPFVSHEEVVAESEARIKARRA